MSRFSEAQIIAALLRQETGGRVRDIGRDLAISEWTLYIWKANFGGMSVSELKRVKDLETHNARIKRMYANLSLAHDPLKRMGTRPRPTRSGASTSCKTLSRTAGPSGCSKSSTTSTLPPIGGGPGALDRGRYVAASTAGDPGAGASRREPWLAADVSRRQRAGVFVSHKLDAWCNEGSVIRACIQPDSPTQNTYFERRIGSLRRELLDAYVFRTLDKVRQRPLDWQRDYNNQHPNKSLGDQTRVAALS